MAIPFDRQTRLLFIGDSITDCDRRKDPDALGSGYVRIVRDYLAAQHPTAAPQILNRGISGNKVTDLHKRWQRDVLDLSPHILSIFIGINDVWHGLVPDRTGCDLPTYLATYRNILTQSRSAFPNLHLILCEPSVLWLTQPPDANQRLRPYIQAIHQLATEFSAAAVVPLHHAFNRANDLRPDIPWTTDGVHPTSAGHTLIALQWLAAVGWK